MQADSRVGFGNLQEPRVAWCAFTAVLRPHGFGRSKSVDDFVDVVPKTGANTIMVIPLSSTAVTTQ